MHHCCLWISGPTAIGRIQCHWLGIQLPGSTYHTRIRPAGLSTAPWVFHRFSGPRWPARADRPGGAMSRSTDALGAYGERCAVRHRRRNAGRGPQLAKRQGELDIVALDGEMVVFCEVKTRRSDTLRYTRRGGGRDQGRRLRRAGGEWLAGHPQLRGRVRFDVIAVHAPGGAGGVEHLQGAF